MVTMAQSTANWRNTHTHMGHTHSLTHLHQYSYNCGAKHQLSYYFSVHAVFLCFCNPPTSDMDYRIFIVHT